MVGWFKKQPKAVSQEKEEKEREQAVAEGALKLVSKLGDILQRMEPEAILAFDTAELPAPKAAMKSALKIAWHFAPSDEVRNALDCAFIYLAHFQDGVGSTPITNITNSELARLRASPDGFGLELERLGPKIDQLAFWTKKVHEETCALDLELAEFKRQRAELE